MTHAQRSRLAEDTVAATLRRLPPAIREIAARVPVVHHDWPSEAILGDEFEPDILGMFVGSPYGAPTGENPVAAPHILLFLENLWDYAEEDRAIFRDEVRLTYLHELGHYLGWDEDEVAARGLE
ncbi:MAG: metallopeptidase family protein [Verrucomicrobia bacterium]|nr:metallopeptidase family protein [Verrucomicrobiota bacterium]